MGDPIWFVSGLLPYFPNLVRGSVIPMTWIFTGLNASLGTPPSAVTLGLVVVGLAWFTLLSLRETYFRDLQFQEAP